MYTRSPEEIVAEWRSREGALAPEVRTARLVRDVYNGDVAVPLPASASAEEKLSIANFVEITIDHNAQRIVSVSESIETFPSKPGVKKEEDRAREQRLVSLDWLTANRVRRRSGRWARQYVAYGCAATLIRPDKKLKIPKWDRRDPLACFPGFTDDPDEVRPPDAIFAYARTWGWLLRNFPTEAGMLYMGSKKPEINDLLELIEYVDDEQHTLIIVGRPYDGRSKIRPSGVYSGVGKTIINPGSPAGGYGSHEACVLLQAQNLAGCPLAVIPGRIVLDSRKGQVDGQVPLFFRLQRLTALWDEAIDRGVYPEEWIVNPNGDARVVVQADGRRGIVGEITNGTLITRDLNPGYQTPAAISNIERGLRFEGPLPAESTGESASNVRTGRRGAEIASATLDFGLGESQLVLADARQAELEVAAEVAKGYFGNKQISMYVQDKGSKTYRPKDLFDGVRYRVTFPLPGADANQLYMRSLSKVGGQGMSRKTMMMMDPDIDDVEAETDQIIVEELRDALLQGLKQQAASGQIPPTDIADIMAMVGSNREELAEAVTKVHEAAQQRQAAQPAPGAPEAQPGIAQPGMGAEAGGGAPPAGPPSLAQLLGSVAPPVAA